MSCPNPTVCGSCHWSHIPYPKQLKQKLSDINGSFALKELDLVCETIVASPKTEHYRNRMDFVIDFEGRVGMREKGKWWRVIDNHTCFLADERIEQLFAIVREWTKTAGLTFYDRKANTGLLRYAVIRSTSTGETLINMITSATDDEESVRKALESLNVQAQPTTLIWTVNATISDVSFGDQETIIAGPGYLTERVGSLSYRISPQAFFQTNLYTAPILQETVINLIHPETNTVLDLYCGSGFFSLPAAKRVASVTGVELNASAIEDAKQNAIDNQLTNTAFFSASTESLSLTDYPSDTIILDPPRSGMHDQALVSLMETNAKQLLYVSCNYKNLARELVTLTQRYEVSDLIAIDMFPHTPHVEVVCNLLLKQ